MKRILIIEDNIAIRENTKELLELNAYKVVTAENGTIGFDLAKTFKPDIILCDILMPGAEGRRFLKLAHENAQVQSIPLIFLSAEPLNYKARESLIRKGDQYLLKPFSEEDLLGAIRSVDIVAL